MQHCQWEETTKGLHVGEETTEGLHVDLETTKYTKYSKRAAAPQDCQRGELNHEIHEIHEKGGCAAGLHVWGLESTEHTE